MVETVLVTLASGIACAMAVMFVLHRDYEDGMLGRLALSMIGLAAVARFLSGCDALVAGQAMSVTAVGSLLWFGVALFLSRHAWRFMKYKSLSQRRTRAAK